MSTSKSHTQLRLVNPVGRGGVYTHWESGATMKIPGRTKRKSFWVETRRAFALCVGVGCVLPFGSLFAPVALAQERSTRKNIPEAPLPAAVVHARKVFLLNGQTSSQYLTKNGNILAFDTLYAYMKSWGRYELADSPTDADIVIELQYRPYSDRFGADFALVIYEAKSKGQLWSVSDEPGAARLVKNQQKKLSSQSAGSWRALRLEP
jgi:hypothetical protein